MSACNLTQTISGSECIGASRPKINDNFTNLDTAICNLSGDFDTTTNTLSSYDSYLLSLIDTLSTTVTGIDVSFNTNNVGLSTTLTTYVSSLSVYTPAGSYIGFIPIYR